MRLTRDDLATLAWQRVGCTKIAAKTAIDTLFAVLTETLVKGDTVFIKGHLTLEPVMRAGRPTRHIRNGEAMYTPAHLTVRAKFAPRLSSACLTKYKRDERFLASAEAFYKEVEK